ncbi:GNAT family N-acetyltransferase [Neolewinella antarctica]|uniref:Ribosomal protein S18 acetylase RimI-like enzyme n=1 Tax=Neolewinella antarctica TaxID=442734 RepID=A0ABX0X9X4_9BACT|nr:GNAT family N-acetyltransferase [Neolewinella antarctica]NJC26049.1 ribosomal protein S18 acetylase RimI-like enzyme [Neolewinella antarctica]
MIKIKSSIRLNAIEPADYRVHYELMQRIYPSAFAYMWSDDGAWYVKRIHEKSALLLDLKVPDSSYHHVYFREKLVGILRLKFAELSPDFPNQPALKIDRVYLDDNVRGEGLGTKLIDYAKEEARRRGKKILWLERMDTNEATINFYRKCGFVDGSSFRLTFPLLREEFRGMHRMSWRVE